MCVCEGEREREGDEVKQNVTGDKLRNQNGITLKIKRRDVINRPKIEF